MLSDVDIYRAAHLMIHEYGNNAEREAAKWRIGCSGAATGASCSPGSEYGERSP
jgi:hypothetical protein